MHKGHSHMHTSIYTNLSMYTHTTIMCAHIPTTSTQTHTCACVSNLAVAF